MIINRRIMRCLARALAMSLMVPLVAFGQRISQGDEKNLTRAGYSERVPDTVKTAAIGSSVLTRYFDPVQGSSANDLVRMALSSNGELIAGRLDIDRARARLRQAGLRPNPAVDFEQTTGSSTGSPGESETSIGISLPLEVGGQRHKRITLAQAELEATQAEVAERERRLAGDVLAAYAEALAALRELEITEGLNEIDLQTARFVQARVNEGDSAPIELSLLQVEVDRLKSRRVIVEGRLQASMLRLKNLAGLPLNEPLRLRERFEATTTPWKLPGSIEAATEIALRTRPDLRLARLNEETARAGLRLAIAQGRPEVVASARYTQNHSVFDDTPVGPIRDRDKLLTFGVSLGLPVFNRNQGAKAGAALAIKQAERRREYVEAVIRSEVAAAYSRVDAAQRAALTFDQGVIGRSNDNIRAIRAAYQLGEFKITDLLAEQRRLLDSQKDFTETLAERYRAMADLQSAMGTATQPQ
jgi:cobalt-zinc-cadmium efflux system outer membrane protein